MQQFSYSLSNLNFKNGTIDDHSPIGSQLLDLLVILQR